MNKFKLDTFTKYNLFELCGRTTRITACSWDSVTLDKNQHNSSTVNTDTKWFFDNINDITIDEICAHYGTDKYYKESDINIASVVVQITIIPASIYTAKGMYNGYIIFANDFIKQPIVLTSGEYPYILYDNPNEPAVDYFTKTFDKTLCEFNLINDYIIYNTTNKQKVLNDIKEDIIKKYQSIIDTEFEEKKIELDQNLKIKEEELNKCISYAKRNKYMLDALHIDTKKYTQLFDYD